MDGYAINLGHGPYFRVDLLCIYLKTLCFEHPIHGKAPDEGRSIDALLTYQEESVKTPFAY